MDEWSAAQKSTSQLMSTCDVCLANGNLPLDQAKTICNGHIAIFQQLLRIKQRENAEKESKSKKRPRQTAIKSVPRRPVKPESAAAEDPNALIRCSKCNYEIYARCGQTVYNKRICASCFSEGLVYRCDHGSDSEEEMLANAGGVA